MKAVTRSVTNKLFGPVARAEKDYATHIPVLLSLAQAIKVEKVLELGCGEYSTLTFLNTTAFPSLVTLDSLETDQAWLDKISEVVGDDSRLRSRFVPGAMLTAIEETNLDEYDLIFVDDSTTSEERSATITALSRRQPKRPVIVIHDFEVQAYRHAAKTFQHQFTSRAFNPQIGIVWNGEKDLTKALRRAEAVMKRYAKKLDPDNVREWESALRY